MLLGYRIDYAYRPLDKIEERVFSKKNIKERLNSNQHGNNWKSYHLKINLLNSNLLGL